MKACIIAVALAVAMLALAPLASAGPNGGWGKGLLSATVDFDANVVGVSGYMYYCPDATEFIFDFHGYGFTDDVTYDLICYEDTPDEYTLLGSAGICLECPTGDGVHIKGTLTQWPEMDDATVCLVSGSTVYLTSSESVDLSGP